jgi:hypothetical protein
MPISGVQESEGDNLARFDIQTQGNKPKVLGFSPMKGEKIKKKRQSQQSLPPSQIPVALLDGIACQL